MKLKYSKKRHFSNKTKRNKHKLRKSKKRAINYTNKKNRKRHVKRGGAGKLINLSCTQNGKQITCEEMAKGAGMPEGLKPKKSNLSNNKNPTSTPENNTAAAAEIKKGVIKKINALTDKSSQAEFDDAITNALDVKEFKKQIGTLEDKEDAHTILRQRPKGETEGDSLKARIQELKATLGTQNSI